MSVVVIDYGSANLRSVVKALTYVGADVTVTNDSAVVRLASRIILPGVGAFADCIRGLAGLPGYDRSMDMADALTEAVISRGQPFLGICLGMQIMATRSYENGIHDGLGWIDGEVIPIKGTDGIKVPHMGWNEITIERPNHPVLDGISSGDCGYFVHGYKFVPGDEGDILATVDYGERMTAIVGRDNMVGVQFHPEKSQAMGLRLLSNFLNWQP